MSIYALERFFEGVVWLLGASIIIAFLTTPPVYVGWQIMMSFGERMTWNVIDIFSAMILGYFALLVIVVILAISGVVAFLIYDVCIDGIRILKQRRKKKNDRSKPT